MSGAVPAVCFNDCKSEPKFGVEFVLFEKPRRGSDQVPTHASLGKTLAVIQLLLWSPLLFAAFERGFLESSRSDAELQSCSMWSPFREENILP